MKEELKEIIKKYYIPAGAKVGSNFFLENTSSGHVSYRVNINGKDVIVCFSKITEARPGNFVTLYKRVGSEIKPYYVTEGIDLVIVDCKYLNKEGNDLYHGQFFFSKDILGKKKIFASAECIGKTAIRVFPVWVQTSTESAQKTQKWQSNYFVEFKLDDLPSTIKSIATIFDKLI